VDFLNCNNQIFIFGIDIEISIAELGIGVGERFNVTVGFKPECPAAVCVGEDDGSIGTDR
jgi:hypothetical protein